MRLALVSLPVIALLAGCSRPTQGQPVPPETTASAVPVPPAASAAPPAGADVITTSQGDLAIHPVMHATLWMTFGGKTLVLDPWSKAGAKLDGVKADYVFLTDIHGDHFDPDGLAKVKQASTVLVGPKVLAEKVPGLVVMANGEKKDFGGFSVEAVPMYNLQRGPGPGKLFHDKGRGNGYVMTFGDKRVYVSGDTECVPEIKALPAIDVAFLCMNLPYTMPPSEAGECARAFKPKVLYPYHHRDSNPDEMGALPGTEVRKRAWYLAQRLAVACSL
jgi:L-ascorbate metabolism protein UlaG (beta-lactamase superfamily)